MFRVGTAGPGGGPTRLPDHMPTRPIALLDRALRLAAALLLISLLASCSDLTDPGEALSFATVSAGALHTCGVTATGRVYCWGGNQYGQLGDGTTEDRALPVRIQADFLFEQVSAGLQHTCALARGGVIHCWGGNFNGELGDGTQTNRSTPALIAGGLRFRSVTAGEGHTCGITQDDLAYCWGAALGPAPGGGSLPNQTRPRALSLGQVASLSAGYEIACAVTLNGTTYCWGLRPPGIEFAQDPEASAVPLPVRDAPSLVIVSAGHKHACGITAGRETYCWGRNTSGQLGDATLTSRHTPMPVSGEYVFETVSAEAPAHTCALTEGGAAYCWGYSQSGELGDSSIGVQSAPVAVSGDLAFASLSVGFVHTCGVTLGGAAYCWGSGQKGQLGTGQLEDSRVPVRVAAPLP